MIFYQDFSHANQYANRNLFFIERSGMSNSCFILSQLYNDPLSKPVKEIRSAEKQHQLWYKCGFIVASLADLFSRLFQTPSGDGGDCWQRD